MSNFLSALGQGLVNFGGMRQQRQFQEAEFERDQDRLRQQQQDRDRNYAWEVASHMSPNQVVDTPTWETLSKAGPELGAYVQLDPVSGQRKWIGTQQQKTNAAREAASLDMAKRQNAVLSQQQEELERVENLNKAMAEFTATHNRRPTRDELYQMGSSLGALSAKDLINWDMQDKQIASQEAMAKRALAAAQRDNRWMPTTRQQPSGEIDYNVLRAQLERRHKLGMIKDDVYENARKGLERQMRIATNPLQAYMNDFTSDLTEYYNQKNPNTDPIQWDPSNTQVRNSALAEEFLSQIIGSSDWAAQAESDNLDVDRYVQFIQQQIEKIRKDEEARAAQQQPSWYEFWR